MALSRVDQPKAQFKLLRTGLDDLYSCLDCCLNHIHVKSAFLDMCNVLNEEFQALIESVRSLEYAYKFELPLESQEPMDVNWCDEKERLLVYRDSFIVHEFALNSDAYFKKLLDNFIEISESFEHIDKNQIPINDYKLYVSYGKRELDIYTNTRWGKELRFLRNDIAGATNIHQNEFFSTRLKDVIGSLRSIHSYIVSDDASYIYYEGLGRCLWTLRHSAKTNYSMDDVLVLVKKAEYLSKLIDQKIVFIDCEKSPKKETDENRIDSLREETLQKQLPKVVFRLGRCSELLDNGFSKDFFEEMLRNLIASKHSAKVCEKMCNRKINKFTLQIAGLLKENDVFGECSCKDLAKAIGFTKPTMESCVSYISKQIDDETEIQQWITDYIAQYRNRHNLS